MEMTMSELVNLLQDTAHDGFGQADVIIVHNGKRYQVKRIRALPELGEVQIDIVEVK